VGYSGEYVWGIADGACGYTLEYYKLDCLLNGVLCSKKTIFLHLGEIQYRCPHNAVVQLSVTIKLNV
jgi:hypothetical protein